MMNNVIYKWKKFIVKESDEHINDNLMHNFRELADTGIFDQDSFHGFDKSKLLKKIRLGEKLGDGAFGAVFKIEGDEHVIKIFWHPDDPTLPGKDPTRFESVIKDMFKGSSSSLDMHYFEHGRVGSSDLYYVIMPKIVPLKESPFYRYSNIFDIITQYCSFIALAHDEQGTKPSYIDFKYEVLDSVETFIELSKDDVRDQLTEDLEQYSETSEKIIKAAHRAFTKFGGTDLHSGNIGYFAQKPDNFFYYDM